MPSFHYLSQDSSHQVNTTIHLCNSKHRKLRHQSVGVNMNITTMDADVTVAMTTSVAEKPFKDFAEVRVATMIDR